MVPKSAILYQNALGTVTLIDIPTSLARAQLGPECTCLREILSTPALEAPYPSTEPKSDKARKRVIQRNHAGSGEDFPTELLVAALEEVVASGRTRWCHERRTSLGGPPVGEASLMELGETKSDGQGATTKSTELTPDAALREPVLACDQAEGWQALEPMNLSFSPPAPLPLKSITDRLIYNSSPHSIAISVDDVSKHYFLPPKSSFLLSKISASSTPALSMAICSQIYDETATAGPGQFDFILLDPPWSNRSVRRSKAYVTEQDPMEALQPMLGQHIAQNGLVACWITSKPNTREIAAEAFEAWGVELLEEWAWLKVTANGKPVTEIEGLWRKPYEILLIGRKRHDENVSEDTPKRSKQLKVIVAVPDIHSRKPQLKELVEPMMADPNGYRALEVFGRNLTAGWWTCGNEVLRFNWSNWWIQQDSCKCQSRESP